MKRSLLPTLLLATIAFSSSCSSGTSPEEVKTSEVASSGEEALKQNAAAATDAYRAQLQKDIAKHAERTFTTDQLVRKARATKGYYNNQVYVEGVIKRTGIDEIEQPYVLLKSKDRVYSVKVILTNKNELKVLKTGDKVTFDGNCQGFILSNLILIDATQASSLSSLKDNLKNL